MDVFELMEKAGSDYVPYSNSNVKMDRSNNILIDTSLPFSKKLYIKGSNSISLVFNVLEF